MVAAARHGEYALIFSVAHALLGAGGSLIAEANFFRGMTRRASRRCRRAGSPRCTATRRSRCSSSDTASRTRHPGHLDGDRVGELRSRFESGLNGALDLDAELIELDTTSGTVEGLAARVVERLEPLRFHR